MGKEVSYTAIAFLAILVASMFTVLPAKAFVQPNGTVDTNYELFGPHADQLTFQMYDNLPAEWYAMEQDNIDLTDWPLTTAERILLVNYPYNNTVNVVSAGPQNSYYVIDFNLDSSPTIPNPVSGIPRPNPVWNPSQGSPAYPNGIPPITSNVYFRLACGNLFSRTVFNVFMGASGMPILTPIPAYMAGYIWSGATPYTYGAAAALPTFYTGHIYNYTNVVGSNSSSWYWDYQGIGPHVPVPEELAACNLEITWTLDDYRTQAGTMLHTALVSMGFTFSYAAQVTSGQNYARVMLAKNYLITTLGYSNIGPDPDYLYDLYNGNNFWDDASSSCPNTADMNDPVLNSMSAEIKTATTQSAALTACITFQQRFWTICPEIPLCSPNCYMASAKYYSGGNNGTIVLPDDEENDYRRPWTVVRYDWPMFHHDLNHTGYSTWTAPNTNDTKWTCRTSSTVSSSPAVVDDKVYVGSDGGNVICLNALTGAYIWNYKTGDIVESSPAVFNGKVYVGSHDGNVTCLNALTGAYVWNYTTNGRVLSSPAVVNGKVYVGSDDGNVTCLDALTGAYVWNYTTNGPVASSPAVFNGKVYVGSHDGNVTCLDASTGAYVWNYTTGNAVWSSPVVVEGKVIVGSDDHIIYCLNSSTGTCIWNYTTGGSVMSSPAVSDGIVYVGSYDSDVYAFGESPIYGPVTYGSRREWLGIGNQVAYGTNTWFSPLNMYPANVSYAPAGNDNMTIRVGWSTNATPQHLNPLYSDSYWEDMVLREIYDTLGYRNIYNLAQWMPDLIENWTVGTWYDGNVGQTKSMVTFTLRPDLYWNDGVPLTLKDVIFSLVEVGALAVSHGYPPPWWWPTGELVQSLTQIDAYTCQILLNIQSIWAADWILGDFYIIPEHVWKPIILTGNPVQTIADPNMIGSGPWRYANWQTSANITLFANTPGSKVTCAKDGVPLSGAVPTTSPEGYHNYCPLQVTVSTSNNPWSANDYQVIWNVTSMTVKSATGTVTCTILNKWWNNSQTGFLTVDDYEYVDGVLQGGYPESDTLWSNTTDTDVVTGAPITFNVGLHTIQNTANVTGPADINASVPNPWLGQNITATIRIYVTSMYDIGGSTFYDDIGWGNQTYSPPLVPALKIEFQTPDFIIDGRDITLAARAYASYPGESLWSSVADVNHDYHVDGRDITLIARQYHWNY